MNAIVEFGGKDVVVPEEHFPIRINFNGKEYTIKITKHGRLVFN